MYRYARKPLAHSFSKHRKEDKFPRGVNPNGREGSLRRLGIPSHSVRPPVQSKRTASFITLYNLSFLDLIRHKLSISKQCRAGNRMRDTACNELIILDLNGLKAQAL